VQPTLQGADRKSLKHMLLHTQVTRLLGPLDAWPAAFAAIAAGGYNSVYLTPAQRISPASGSAFCIAEQLQLGLSLFDGDVAAASHGGALDKLRAVIESCSRALRMTFVTDIVLNHVALDAPFLLEHPESAYNLNNSPHLNAAALLDASLQSFGHRVLNGEFADSGLVPVVLAAAAVFLFDSDADISKFVDVFFTQVHIPFVCFQMRCSYMHRSP
jgi:glycogen debranching enzyme